MAEAAVEAPAARFFCHQCVQEVSPVLPDYLCSRCHSGFIEELAQPAPEPRSSDFARAPDAFSLVAGVMRALGGNMQTPDGRNVQGGTWSRSVPSRRQPYRIDRSASQRTTAQDSEARNARAEGILQQFIVDSVESLMENYGILPQGHIPVVLNLHGNPGDYVWGRGGWNAIITQLINQLDGTGPPPLPREKIEEIPTVNITQEQVDKNLQCTVCMEDFKLGEPVRLLPCQHHFHKDCIIPWLQLHGTCPICRKLLMDESGQRLFSSQPNDDYALNPEPGPSGVATTTTSTTARPTESQQNVQNDSSSGPNNNSSHNPSTSAFDYSDEF